MGLRAQTGSVCGSLKVILVVLVALAIVAVSVWVFAGRNAALPADENSVETPIDHGVPPPMPYGSPKQPTAKPAAQPPSGGDASAWGQ